MSVINKEKIDAAYAPLKTLMKDEFGVSVDVSQMNNILNVVDVVNGNIDKLYRVKCDVVGCDNDPSCGGMYYRESGYWTLCMKHADDARKGLPAMFKPEAIQREQNRKPNNTASGEQS